MGTIQKSNIEIPRELINWSKWMIGVNFSAGTGCVVVLRDLKSNESGTISFWLLTAITLFAFTILTSIIFNLILSLEIRDDFRLKKKHWVLGGVQLGLFTLALFALLAWVVA